MSLLIEAIDMLFAVHGALSNMDNDKVLSSFQRYFRDDQEGQVRDCSKVWCGRLQLHYMQVALLVYHTRTCDL